MANSRVKGASGERELAKWFRDNLNVEARRGQQFSGSPDSPDIVTDIGGLYIECKRREKLGSLHDVMARAQRDAGEKTPVVFHRKNGKPWLITFNADDLTKIVNLFYWTMLKNGLIKADD